MSDFRNQLREDFKDYRERHPHIEYLQKDEWAFNFWILDNLFRVDEEIIESQIVDYNDKGIDCYVWHEDTHDLYLIQNKFYSDGTPITNNYIQNDFLTRAIGALEKGTYTRSPELQDIFNKYSSEDDFSVHFHLYITNDSICNDQKISNGITSFNKKYASKKYDAKIFGLKAITELYFNEPITERKRFKCSLLTINKGTILNVDNQAYNTALALDAKYVLTPIQQVYKMVADASASNYPLFDENIREYLGSSGAVNKKIKQTLMDPNDRKNFFFYNNGITMIVSEMSDCQKGTSRSIDIEMPQIVNGCQTASTIFEVLNSLPRTSIDEDFKNTYVMIRILKIPSNNQQLESLYKNIVTYNNSQNSINTKHFIASKDVFKRVQQSFDKYGFLVCIKQSDKYKFKNNYTTVAKQLDKNKGLIEKFSLKQIKNVSNFIIDLEKLLQVILAFSTNLTDAVQNKSKLLNDGKSQNKAVIEAIQNPESTDKDLVNLYLLYLRAEEAKKNNKSKIPNPLFLIYCFARYECNSCLGIVSSKLDTKENIDKLMLKYISTLTLYYNNWVKKNEGKEYNDMMKSALDLELLDDCKTNAESTLALLSRI